MTIEDIYGLFAGCLTTISLFPQIIKTYRTRSTTDISLVMFIILSIGSIMWLIYAIIRYNLPMIISNSITMILSFIMIYLKIYNK